MYGVIAVFFQYLRQCRHLSGALYSRFLAYAVYIPFRIYQHRVRIYQHRVRLFVCLVFMQCPTGHPVSCRIHSGKQADAAWRTYTTGIRLRKHHALCRQALHIGRLINVIVMCTLRPKAPSRWRRMRRMRLAARRQMPAQQPAADKTIVSCGPPRESPGLPCSYYTPGIQKKSTDFVTNL